MKTRLTVRVRPGVRSRGRAVAVRADGSIVVGVPAPAVDGRANAAAIEVLAELLGVRVKQVAIVRGRTSRLKVIEVEGLDAAVARRRIADAVPDGERDGE